MVSYIVHNYLLLVSQATREFGGGKKLSLKNSSMSMGNYGDAVLTCVLYHGTRLQNLSTGVHAC